MNRLEQDFGPAVERRREEALTGRAMEIAAYAAVAVVFSGILVTGLLGV